MLSFETFLSFAMVSRVYPFWMPGTVWNYTDFDLYVFCCCWPVEASTWDMQVHSCFGPTFSCFVVNFGPFPRASNFCQNFSAFYILGNVRDKPYRRWRKRKAVQVHIARTGICGQLCHGYLGLFDDGKSFTAICSLHYMHKTFHGITSGARLRSVSNILTLVTSNADAAESSWSW